MSFGESYSAREQFWWGLAAILFSLIPLWVYFTTDVMTVESLDKITIRPEYTSFRESSKSDKIVMGMDSIKYEVPYNLWKDSYETDAVLDVLRQSEEVELWTKPSESKFVRVCGLNAEGVYLNPDKGVRSANSNRQWALVVAVMFMALGVVLFFTSAHTRKRVAGTNDDSSY